MKNVLLLIMLAITFGCLTDTESANETVENQTVINIDNLSITSNDRNTTDPKTINLTNRIRIPNISRPNDELLENFVKNVSCERWSIISAQFQYLNITAVSCNTEFDNEVAYGKCPVGYSGYQCYFIFDGSGFEIMNAESLKTITIVDTRQKALDFVKAVLQSGVFYQWHMGDWYYDKESLKNASCVNKDNANLTSAIETPDGYFVTVLRQVQYQCVKPKLVEEHYFVSYEGNFT